MPLGQPQQGLSVLAQAAADQRFEGLRAHRQDGARAGLKRLRAAASARRAEALASALESPEGRRFFAYLFGNSPHLGGLLMRDLEFTEALVTTPADGIAQQVRNALAQADPLMGRDGLRAFLRRQRNRVAVLAAVYDCFGIWGVMQCAELLSDMADHAVRLATAHLLQRSVARGDLAPPEEAGRSGYFVLALGKHGARELNYSSDIDLIVIYDPRRVRCQGRRSAREHMARITRDLVGVMQGRDADGYVFRTDLRLRPDAAATPLAVTLDFALDYYPDRGRTWERAAMIKARPVAGDLQSGAEFLERLSPFIWDEGLDFNSVEEIRALSEQIHDFHGHGAVQLAGHNLKLGRGGIREIEFFVHMHQLAYGGRNRRLRGKQVLPLLATLEEQHHIMPREADSLRAAYLLLRRVEHRLQMINDNQTQTLPETADGLAHIATFMNLSSREALGQMLGEACAEVHALYCARFNVPERELDIGEAILAGPQGSPDVADRLRAAGFTQAQGAFDILRGWAEGRHPAMASQRNRAIARDILHDVVEAVGKTADADRTLMRLDRFLAALPERNSFFSMLRAHSWLLHLIALVMGGAPAVAERLRANPRLMEAVSEPFFFLPIAERAALAEELEERLEGAQDFRRSVDAALAWGDDRRFQVAVQTLQNLITQEEACDAYVQIADVLIEALWRVLLGDLARRPGRPLPAAHALVALGDLGAKDLIFASSLDLVLVLDVPETQRRAPGPDALAAQRLGARAALRLQGALRRRTPSGALHQAQVAFATLSSFVRAEQLQESGALGQVRKQAPKATGARMALARARVLCGDPHTVQRVQAAIGHLREGWANQGGLDARTAALRERMARARCGAEPFDLQQARGGLVDLELLVRHLQLLHAPRTPTIFAGNAAAGFAALARAGRLSRADADCLAEAYRLQRALEGLVELTWGAGPALQQAPNALKERWAQAFDCDGFAALQGRLRQVQRQAHGICRRHFA